MQILNNQELKKYTTFKMGGICKKMWFPENERELMELLEALPKPYYLLGGGSNLVINEKKIFENVICMRKYSGDIIDKGNGNFCIGGSVRLQKLIKTINEKGYGGIEYLYSVPGLVGGAIYMNAGRGRGKNKSISDYVVKVVSYSDGKIVERSREECCFGYRESIFQKNDEVILHVECHFEMNDKDKLKEKREERIKWCQDVQDNSGPNFGTVFCIADGRIMKFFSKISNSKKNIHFSKKTPNWMINTAGKGEYDEVKKLLKEVKFVHKIFRKKCKQEVILWE